MEIKLKNYHIAPLFEVMSYEMAFSKGRVKNRFLKQVEVNAKLYEENRLAMAKKLCKKKAGEPDLDGNGNFQFEGKNKDKFFIEFDKMNEEPCVLTYPLIKEDLPTIISIIENSKVELDIYETRSVEEALEIMESTLEGKKIKTNKKDNK